MKARSYYLGVDVGSISTKGVITDSDGEIYASEYLWTEGNPVGAVRRLADALKLRGGKYRIAGAGATGSARRLAGLMLNANCVKNEITAHAVGTLKIFPDVRTIIEIGGQDSKVIFIEDGIVSDYAMNTLCAAGTGAFLSSQARRLGTEAEELGAMALKSERPASIAARCTVFAESDLVHKAQTGYKTEDIAAGLCNAVALNFLNNLCRGKKLVPPVVFQGGVSRNAGVARAFEARLGFPVLVDGRGHLAGALGASLLSRGFERDFRFNPDLIYAPIDVRGGECAGCGNKCELVAVFRGGRRIDVSGGRCDSFVFAET